MSFPSEAHAFAAGLQPALVGAYFRIADLLAAHGAALPGRIDAVLRDRWEETAGPPGFPQALEHLGSFTHPDGEVRLMWSGNRVCVPSELTERERVHLARHWD